MYEWRVCVVCMLVSRWIWYAVCDGKWSRLIQFVRICCRLFIIILFSIFHSQLWGREGEKSFLNVYFSSEMLYFQWSADFKKINKKKSRASEWVDEWMNDSNQLINDARNVLVFFFSLSNKWSNSTCYYICIMRVCVWIAVSIFHGDPNDDRHSTLNRKWYNIQ